MSGIGGADFYPTAWQRMLDRVAEERHMQVESNQRAARDALWLLQVKTNQLRGG